MSKAAELANLIGNINAGGGGVNRNVIINGAMNVAQRGTSTTGLGANTTAGTNSTRYKVCDRWAIDVEGTTLGRYTLTQDSSAPSGFANSLKLDCTTADGSIASGEAMVLNQIIEGQNLQAFAKGTSDAKPFAVSFYVKGNASATYVCELFDGDNSRHVAKTFSVTTDWARVELSFPADTTGAFGDDVNASLYLQIWLHAGATFKDPSGTLPATWASKTNGNRAVGGDSFFSSTDRTFFITGVQLEVGQNPTTFEHEPFDVTRRKCFRYFEKIEVTAGSYAHVAYAYTTTGMRSKQTYEKKRANPTFTFDNQGDVVCFYNGGTDADPTFNYHDAGPNSCRVSIDLTGVSTTAGYGAAVYVNGSVTYNIKVDAEL
jgi:hypothetical protein